MLLLIAFCCCCLKWGIEIGSYVALANFEFTVAEAGLELVCVPKSWCRGVFYITFTMVSKFDIIFKSKGRKTNL